MSENAGFVDWNLMAAGGEEANKEISKFKETVEDINSKSFAGFGSKIIDGLKGIGKAFGSMLLQAGTAMLVAKAIEGIVWAFDYFIETADEAIEAAEETKSAWEAMDTAQQQAKDAVDQYGERYDELTKKMSAPSGLTTDEYEEYRDICNELASVFPELVVLTLVRKQHDDNSELE